MPTPYLIIKTILADSVDDARKKERVAKIVLIGEKATIPPAQLEAAIGQPVDDPEAHPLGFDSKTKPRKKRR